MSLSSKVFVSFLSTTVAAVIAWVLIDFTGLHAMVTISHGASGDVFREQALIGALFGMFVGLGLGFTNGLSSGSARKFRRDLLWGAGVGLLGGLLGLFFGQLFFGVLYHGPDSGVVGPIAFVGNVFARSIGWALIGLVIGLAQGLPIGSWRAARHGAVGGLIGGFAGGMLFEVLPYVLNPVLPGSADPGVISRGAGFTVTGAAIGLFVGLVETLMRQAWVRVVQGRNEGREHIISKPNTTIGRDELADISLFGDRDVLPQHAVIQLVGSRYSIRDGGGPAGTVVNGQRVAQQLLRDGDKITIGSMDLEFHEKATATRAVPKKDAARQALQIPTMEGICPFCGQMKHPITGACACSIGADDSGAFTPTQTPAPPPPVPGRSAPPASDSGWNSLPAPPMPSGQAWNGLPPPPMPSGQAWNGLPAPPMPSAQNGGSARIIGVSGRYAGQMFPLTPSGETTVGREPGRDVMLAGDSTVSRRHARISMENGAYVVHDEGSSNGTFVNGQRISRQNLAPGDEVAFGSSGFRFEQ